MNEQEFRAHLTQQGYSDPKTGEYEVGPPSDEHSHDFSVNGMVLSGIFALSTANGTQTLTAGETWTLSAGMPHQEQVVGDGPARILYGTK
jgi:quercetin dioxygenase-like cupin family protein